MNLRHLLFPLLLVAAVSACDRQPAPPVAPAEPAAVQPSAPAAPEPAPAITTQKMSDDAFADLDAMATADLTQSSPNMQTYLQTHFKDGCVVGVPPLSFDQVCQHNAETRDPPPSPWPDLVLGFANGELASLAITDTARSIQLPWECLPAEDNENIRYCYREGTPEADRKRWSGEWSGFFSAGG